MDHELRPDLLPEILHPVSVYVAPAELRRGAGVVSRASDRGVLGPALVATPLVTVGRWRCPVDSAVFADSGPARGHLFVFPRSSVWIRHEGQPPFVADPTVVTYYNIDQRYRRAALSPTGDRGEWFAVTPDALADILRPLDPAAADRGTRLFPFAHGPSDRRSYAQQRAVSEHVRHAAVPDLLAVEETVLDVLRRIVALAYGQGPPRAASSARDRDLADAARAILARRFAEPLSLRAIADAVATSPFHLARAFKRATGATLHGQRTELRLRAALEPLASPSCDLLELALALGYPSHSHFTAVFHAAFGLPPSQLRGRLTLVQGRELVARLGTLRP